MTKYSRVERKSNGKGTGIARPSFYRAIAGGGDCFKQKIDWELADDSSRAVLSFVLCSPRPHLKQNCILIMKSGISGSRDGSNGDNWYMSLEL